MLQYATTTPGQVYFTQVGREGTQPVEANCLGVIISPSANRDVFTSCLSRSGGANLDGLLYTGYIIHNSST